MFSVVCGNQTLNLLYLSSIVRGKIGFFQLLLDQR